MDNLKTKYLTTTLSNGLRVVACHNGGEVCYCGVAVGAGSRDEDAFGLAHFVEHTIFKGTSNRSGWHISNRIESVGGELNAYTSKEETVIYASVPEDYSKRALELLSDLVENATFPEKEIEREKEVVVEEILSALDSPAETVYDDFEDGIYAGSALAHNILGTAETVRALTGADCRRFVRDFYVPSNMVVYISDPGNPEASMRAVEKFFGKIEPRPRKQTRIVPPDVPLFRSTRDRGGHQAHTVLGCRLFGNNDPRRFPLFLFNNHLAGPCMNSRLNQELRERRGLVYTVDGYVSLLSDTGLFSVYLGSDEGTVRKCQAIVDREIVRLAEKGLTERQAMAIRRQYCGQLLLNQDNPESKAIAMGKSVLYFGEVRDAAKTAESLMKVTPEEIRLIAEMVATRGLSRLTLV